MNQQLKVILYFLSAFFLGIILFGQNFCQGKTQHQKKGDKKNILNQLTKEEQKVILFKGTERPFSGKYNKHKEVGIYTCKQCGLPLYQSQDKFDSNCGWPSFDDELPGAVTRIKDDDGIRTEIICSYCKGHLGHVFEGEGYTSKNIRHCVNSISLKFIKGTKHLLRNRAIFAGGCFWGVEYHLQKKEGVLDVRSGFIGGKVKNPTYKQVYSENTGHVEAVEVIFNPQKISYEVLAKLFFEIHDFTQLNRQGPDIGEQYRSEVFYIDLYQKEIIQGLLDRLKKKGYQVKTRLTKASQFWEAEDYHQDYYFKNGKFPYCHKYQKIFD